MTKAEFQAADKYIYEAESTGLGFVHPMEVIAKLTKIAGDLIRIVKDAKIYEDLIDRVGHIWTANPEEGVYMLQPIPRPFNPHQLDDRQIEEGSENTNSLLTWLHSPAAHEVIELGPTNAPVMIVWREKIKELSVHTDSHGEQFFQCLNCLTKSYHPKDISELFCGKCHRFWGDTAPDGFLKDLITRI